MTGKYIFSFSFVNKVKVNKKAYRLRKGISQGGKLSMAFANIYYGFMTKENFEDFSNSGVLIRYIDDFLYITNSKETAKR